MSNNRNIVLVSIPDQISYVKETEDAAGNTEFISIARCSANSLPISLVVVYLETFSNRRL
jgi:hypothetical protein